MLPNPSLRLVLSISKQGTLPKMAGRDSPTVIAKDEISKDNAQAKNIPQNTMGIDEHPEDNASWVSKLMVFWINPLIATAGQRQLSFEDVWATPSNQSAQHDSKVVWSAWEEELNHALVEQRMPSLSQALYMGFRRDFHIAGGLQAVFMFSQIVQPYLVGELVNYIQFGNGGLSYGAGISVALLIISLISSMSFTAGFSILRRMGVSMRSGVMMAVYEKALKLTSASRMQNSIGQTTNLMSIDAEKLFLSVQFLHFIWHGPVANVLVMLLIIQDVGVGPGLLGLASQLALLPIQNYLAECIGRVRREMVKHTDERVKLMNEILQAIRVIKMYAWEGPMEQRIVDVRRKELKCLNLYLSLNSCLRELLFVAGPIASVVVFTSLIYGFGQSITLTEMFRVTAFINILRLPSTLLGQALKNVGDARVSAARLTRFFQSPTLPESSVGQMSTTPQISLKNASFRWETVAVDVQKDTTERTFIQMINSKILSRNSTAGTDDDTKEKKGSAHGADDDDVIREDDTLKNINFSSSSASELIALIGSVGSGKSSLMSALLKEIPLTGGSSSLDGKVAYCAQTPWIQNLSLKDNILFGLDINDPGIASAYEEAINAAALKPDITILPDGDLTEIGERGINLSGGQKARVSIARAILASREAQIVLLDDPFSAVDGSTGNWIFEHGVMGILEGRLRIIALNSHRHLLSRFDRIIVMDNGRIVADGSPTELPQELLFGMEGLGPSNRSPSSNLLSELIKTDISVTPTSSAISQIGTAEAPPSPHFETSTEETSRGRSLSSAKIDHIQSTDEAEAVTRIASKLIVAEERKVGDVSLHVYNKYFGSAFSASGSLFNESGDDNSASKSYTFTCFQTIRSISLMVGLIFMFASAQFVRVAVDYSLARWANYGGTVHGSKLNNSWNTAYFITVGVLFLFLAGRASFLNLLALLSAKHIHEDLFRTVLCAPVTSFFDTHTMGEVLNRFAKDTEIVDSSVPEFLMQALTNWMQIFSVFALSLYATPYFAIVLFPLLIGFYHIYVKFGSAQRDLKRLEAVSRSPVYASLSESLSGLETIRAYGATDRSVTICYYCRW